MEVDTGLGAVTAQRQKASAAVFLDFDNDGDQDLLFMLYQTLGWIENTVSRGQGARVIVCM